MANFLTLLRVALVPLFVYLMLDSSKKGLGDPSVEPYAALAVFTIAAATDSLDGYFARRSGNVSAFGEWLDPFADKLLVGAALVTLVMFRGFPLWAALVVGVREIAVTGLRWWVGRSGGRMPASKQGKVKTIVQVLTVLVWLLPRSGSLQQLQDFGVYAVVILTVWSGWQYFAQARQATGKLQV